MSKSKKKNSINSTQANFDELLLEEINTTDDIPIDWLPKREPITETWSYKED